MIIRAICLVLAAFTLCATAGGATRVPLVIDEPYEDRAAAWPVTTGVPFPRGSLTDVEHCRLVDDRGEEQVLQSRVAAAWDPQRRSIRWLTIDFLARPGRTYALEFGPDVRRKATDSALKVERGDTLTVSTGPLRAEFSGEGPYAIPNVWRDLDGDGRFAATELVAAGVGENYYLDHEGRRFADTGEGRAVEVETSGLVRACVRVDGRYANPEGETIVRHRTRYHFFAGLGLVKVVHEFKIVGSTRGTRFADIGFAVGLPEGSEKRMVAADASGELGNQVERYAWQPDTASVSSFQTTYRHVGNTGFDAAMVAVEPSGENRLRQSDRVGEWMQVRDARASVTGSLRWLWQQFPKEWEATGEKLTLHLWSPRAGELDFGREGLERFFGDAGREYVLDWQGVRGTLTPTSRYFYFAGYAALERGEVDGRGINKHHEFYLHFAAAGDGAEGAEYGRLAAVQPLALATGEWNCSTGVFGPLAARPNDSEYEAIVDRLFDLGQRAQDTFGDYGWWFFGSGPHYSYQWDPRAKRHYADPRRFEYHTYQKETQLWWCYLRSGERKFYDWALPSENHWVDIAVTHVPLTYRCAWRGGARKEQTLTFRPGDWAIDSALHYLRQRDSAEAWLRGGSQFWASYHRTLETTTLAYYLTGDERFNDVIEYWREYWSDLAGKTSASDDFQPWHREQPWYEPTEPGEAEKTWAEMIRDYAPFTSGLRHQMTQFFNLATLYEHTWDPAIGQALRECADVYLDPEHRIGVWRTQENALPDHADAPKLAHYWVPALWKYGRATQDPRMDEIMRRYFDACYGADPFREDVGIYSNVHLAYAYYFTRDPRHLRPVVAELKHLLPHATPLEKPQDLNRRLYNPYAPISSFTAVPRLVWALEAAQRDGAAIPPPPVTRPQRTAIALEKPSGQTLEATLWGYDRELSLIGHDARPYRDFELHTTQYASDLQPFDRQLPNFEVYLHELKLPAAAPAGLYVLRPELDIAVLRLSGEAPLVNAARPIALDPGEGWRLAAIEAGSLAVESAAPKSVRVLGSDGEALPARVEGNTVVFELPESLAKDGLRIENAGTKRLWLRIANLPAERCWMTPGERRSRSLPTKEQTTAALPPAVEFDPDQEFVAGRFGGGLQIVPGRELRIPDHVTVDGETVRLFDMRQGTLEFWVKQLWDDRLAPQRRVTFLSNGLIRAWSPWELPLGEWAHVAVEWRPLKRDPERMAVHIYVNGRDRQNYRSTWWEGYSQKPLTFPAKGDWLKEFLAQARRGAPFAIDELRLSSVPRYADLDTELGHRQLFNPSQFEPPDKPFASDAKTLLLLHFDGSLNGSSALTDREVVGSLSSDP